MMTKLDMEMFHHESWKSVYFVFKRSNSQSTKTVPAWVVAFLWVLASSWFIHMLLWSAVWKVFNVEQEELSAADAHRHRLAVLGVSCPTLSGLCCLLHCWIEL